MRANSRLSQAKNRKLLLEVLEDRWVPAAVNFVPDELLVSFKPGTPGVVMNQALGQANATVAEVIHTPVMKQSGAAPIQVLKLNGMAVDKAMAALSHNPNISFTEPNYIYTTDAISNDAKYTDGSLWGMYSPDNLGSNDPINAYGSQANKAWANGYTGSRSVYVGIIDEGYQYTHVDLANNAWVNPFENPNDGVDNDGNGYVDDAYGWDFANNDKTVFDGSVDDHGTHVAGTIGGQGGNGIGVAGVNWDVSLISAKFLGRNGGTLDNAIKALDYLTDLKTRHGLNIVASNNSWGGGGYSVALEQAIGRSNDANILFVAAAGNNGANNDGTANYPSNYTVPNVIAVAAIDNSGALASFSNYGAAQVDLGAPGVSIMSTLPSGSYAYYSGTSMATPHVTGTAALYASLNPGATAAQIKNAILGNVTATASLNGKTVTGGRLDVWKTLQSASTPSSTLTASINDVAKGEGNSGQTTFTFTVTLSAPAPMGGVTISYATKGGSAIGGDAAGSSIDYITTIGSLTIPENGISGVINITVYGDTSVEADETFYVNLTTNTAEVLFADNQGVGTITNDDGSTTGGKTKPRSASTASSADSVFASGLSVIPDASLISWLSDQGKKPA